MKKESKKYLFILLGGFFLVATIYLTIEAGANGSQIASLERQEADLVEQNGELSDRIVTSTSLSDVGKKAADLGFIKPEKIIYISGVEPIAKLP